VLKTIHYQYGLENNSLFFEKRLFSICKYTHTDFLKGFVMQRVFYKFKACDTKSIATSIIHLENCKFITDNNLNHSKIKLLNCTDNLLVEAFNQITTVETTLENNIFETNFSRYIWKLNPEFKENKTRLILLRLLKPIGLFFLVRNINTKEYLSLNEIEFNTFKIKWKSIYNNLPFTFTESSNSFMICIDDNFNNIINFAVEKHIINDTENHRKVKQNILNETLNKLDYLIN